MIGRRDLLKGLAASGAGLAALGTSRAEAEPPPETSRIRFSHVPTVCIAPQYVAEDLLRAEGFTDVQWVKRETGAALYTTSHRARPTSTRRTPRRSSCRWTRGRRS